MKPIITALIVSSIWEAAIIIITQLIRYTHHTHPKLNAKLDRIGLYLVMIIILNIAIGFTIPFVTH